jgi:hypothetical protein
VRLLVVAVVVLTACGGPAAAPEETSAGGRLLYLTGSVDGSGLVPVDSVNLADLSNKPLVAAAAGEPNPCGPGYSGQCALVTASSDASTLAVVGYSPLGAAGVSVFDGRTGTLRARAVPEVPAIVDGLSPEGSRIFARNWPPGPIGAERLVLDVVTGKVLEREPAFALGGDPVAWVEQAEGRRFYALVTSPDPRATGPREVSVAAWDLRSGRELWRRALPSLLAGDFLTGRVGSEGEIRAQLVPAIALSPDGRKLAIVRAFDAPASHGTIWLVDTATGDLVSERAYAKASSIFERLFGASIAIAKENDGTIVSATFGRDGRVLYVRSERWQVDTGYEYLGMVAVEPDRGNVLGSDIKMELRWYQNRVHWMMPAPDGRWLYVFLERTGKADPTGYFLRRLDARTLAVLAERRFDSFRYGFVLAAP